MSREQKLSKKIAHTLLAMSIVYSGGMNVLCNTAFAFGKGADGADKNETVTVTDTTYTGTYTGNNGEDGAGTQYEHTGESGGNGGGTFIELTGSENVSNAISFTAIGGTGGQGKTDIDYNNKGYGGNGGAGGAATVNLTVSGADVTHAAVTLAATGGAGNFAGSANASPNKEMFSDETGSNGGDGGRAEASITVSGTKYIAGDVTLSATGGAGSSDADRYGTSTHGSWGNKLVADAEGNIAKISGGGAGGAAAATGFVLGAGSSLVESVAAADVVITATGGKGGNNTNNSNYTTSATGGIGGAAAAYGIKTAVLLPHEVAFTVSSISVTASGGAGGATSGAVDTRAEQTNTGGTAEAYGIFNTDSAVKASVTGDITVTATGGAAGNGGNASGSFYDGTIVARNGLDGAVGIASGVRNINGHSLITADSLVVQATGGVGGNGGNGGRTDTPACTNGGNGGNGGNAYGYGVQGSGGTTELIADKIAVTATGAAGGSGGTATGSGSVGTAGTISAEAKAYGIYAESGAVVNLSAKTNSGTSGEIKIGAKADNATSTEAYAVYADKATVLFHDNAKLNTSDGASTTDNNVLTFLNNATLGFGGTAANRRVNGGTLKLAGSNTFRVNTDLTAGTADKFTFNSLAAGSSTAAQYITVGYDAALDPYKVGSVAANNGTPIDVLEITSLNGGQNLNNFTGGTTTLDSAIYQYNSTTNVKVESNKVQVTGVTTTKTMIASESVKTASDAQMAMGSMWRMEGNNLMKRMGELRSDKEAAKGGVWARYYRGELSADSAYDREFSQDYTAFQGGIDKVQGYKGGKLYTGIAVNRIDSNAGYTAGSGDLSSTGVGVYASWLGSKGHYLDVIARGSKLSNDFKLVDLSGNAAKADYDTWAYGISAEYGYRQNLNAGWFVEPQAELSLGHIGSADYEMSNGGRIENDGVDSAVTRVGILGGKEFTIGGRPSNAYVKASALHDFGGNGGATAYYGSDSLAMQTGDLTGTWYEIGLGANLGIAKNSNLYFDALKTFGGNLRTDWQFNAGLRFTF